VTWNGPDLFFRMIPANNQPGLDLQDQPQPNPNLSLTNEKRRLLMRHMSFLIFGATGIFFFADLFMEHRVPLYVYAVFILFAIALYLVNRLLSISATRSIGLLAINILIFLVASSEPFETGLHLQFISVGAATLVLHGYEHWKRAILFVLFTFTLHLVTYATDF